MVRYPDEVVVDHRQIFAHSAGSSLVELMLKLIAIEPPGLQLPDFELRSWERLIDRRFGHVVLRRLPPGPCTQLMQNEIAAGRPVGLLLREPLPDGGFGPERAWVAMRWNEMGQYRFAELAGKVPESGRGEGHFTERRVLPLDAAPVEGLAAVFYFEELHPRRIHPSRGRWRKSYD